MSEFVMLDSLPVYVMAEALEDQAPADGLPKWSGADKPPAIGEVVEVRINRCGLAEVVGYFVHEGWLGVRVKLQNPPDWYVKQNGGNVLGHVYGAEIRQLLAE